MSKILVVDDSMTIREMLREVLEGHGFSSIFEAGDGQEAIDIFRREKDIGFIITDCHMPIINGYMMCEVICSLNNGSLPPMLIITAEADIKIREKFKKLGVIGWIMKPIDKAILGPLLADLVHQRIK